MDYDAIVTQPHPPPAGATALSYRVLMKFACCPMTTRRA